MIRILKRRARQLLARLSVGLATRWPYSCAMSAMGKLNRIQLGPEQLQAIARTLKTRGPCRLLVFGLGGDSPFWSSLNRGGVTVFLEDNEDWLQKVVGQARGITAFLVRYDTQRGDWQGLLEHPSSLKMDLPPDVGDQRWDVILVDAPEGWRDQAPGRMQSIFVASTLIRPPADVFVHDCDREVENVCSHRFLGAENLTTEIEGPTGLLRHYRLSSAL